MRSDYGVALTRASAGISVRGVSPACRVHGRRASIGLVQRFEVLVANSSAPAISLPAPCSLMISSSSLTWIACASRFCVFWIRNTIRNVTMVVPGVDDELPGVAEAEERPGDGPDDDHDDGEQEGDGPAGEVGGPLGEDGEPVRLGCWHPMIGTGRLAVVVGPGRRDGLAVLRHWGCRRWLCGTLRRWAWVVSGLSWFVATNAAGRGTVPCAAVGRASQIVAGRVATIVFGAIAPLRHRKRNRPAVPVDLHSKNWKSD